MKLQAIVAALERAAAGEKGTRQRHEQPTELQILLMARRQYVSGL
jgi:hypothetical protein